MRPSVSALRFALLLLAPSMSFAVPVVFTAAGPNGASIQATVDNFRASLGTLNANLPGSVGSGRREINWDGVPDAASSPNPFSGNFFNANVAGRARGASFSTPGSGFQVSANALNPSSSPIEFGNINATYPSLFSTFSAQRLFTAIDSNVVDVNFFVPGSTTPALTSGFGAVFADVDLANLTSIEFFGATNQSLGTYFAEALAGANESLSFLGVYFNEGAVVSRVRLTNGNAPLLLNEAAGRDLVVMDDFIYGEPTVNGVPEPSTALLVVGGLLAARLTRRRD